MRVLLISTYDLGRQPFGLASPAAWLRHAGVEVRCLDLAKDPYDEALVASADVVALHLPMHTATRLAVPTIRRIREAHAGTRIVAYGLYALPNADALRATGVDVVLGPEYEADLVRVALDSARTVDESEPTPTTGATAPATGSGRVPMPRLAFLQPERSALPSLSRYVSLQMPDGSRRVTGYTEASRGCRHRCRHCPVVPLYDGRFRVVPPEVVLADIAAQVASGARHITFGDPDFLNGPRHAERVVRGLAQAHPGVTYDVTVKVEHLLQHPDVVRTLAATGCLFITSAVESVDDEVLARLEKGHSRTHFEEALRLVRSLGLTLVPTFVAFTPWTTRASYVRLLDAIERFDLIEQVSPIQLTIRLLIPRGSRLLELPDVAALVEPFDEHKLAYPWRHPDPELDLLQGRLANLVGRRLSAPRREIFDAVRVLAADVAGHGRLPPQPPRPSRATVPYLTEPWYC